MIELFANSRDPDQTPQSVASDLGLHCLPTTLLGPPDYNGLTLKVLFRMGTDNTLKYFFLFLENLWLSVYCTCKSFPHAIWRSNLIFSEKPKKP